MEAPTHTTSRANAKTIRTTSHWGMGQRPDPVQGSAEYTIFRRFKLSCQERGILTFSSASVHTSRERRVLVGLGMRCHLEHS